MSEQLSVQQERAAIGWWIGQHVDFGPVDSVRHGWHEAICDCGWRTTGMESVVDDAIWEHASECMKPPVALIDRAERAETQIARIRQIADQWNATPDYLPSSYDRGRVDQRHEMTEQLLTALDAETTTTNPTPNTTALAAGEGSDSRG